MKIFHASYIRRAEMYGNKINETTADDVDKTTLYADAVKLCDDIIAGVYGTYKLEEYFLLYLPNEITRLCSVYWRKKESVQETRYLWVLPVKVNTEQPVEEILLRG